MVAIDTVTKAMLYCLEPFHLFVKINKISVALCGNGPEDGELQSSEFDGLVIQYNTIQYVYWRISIHILAKHNTVHTAMLWNTHDKTYNIQTTIQNILKKKKKKN